ncbi:unnamed protein product [Arctia plantaginis]|uniref:Uncharacterized protein n=1 Tax=Arctia plantaginis TaxID=874455 RepID=A0A8S0YYI8_ARCPL|nr:unnamed protein product [Arctia plantaginis]
MYHYDSVSNFIEFHHRYRRSSSSLEDFFHDYEPPILSDKLTCVGQGIAFINLMKALNGDFPGVIHSTGLLSCQESVKAKEEQLVTSVEGPHALDFVSGEKEHVVVGIRIKINGREGVMIADPGYHLGVVITIMKDKKPPHTGVFVRHNSFLTLKEFDYSFHLKNANFIKWHEVEYRKGINRAQLSLIFNELPFVSAVLVTEKRNLVYTFKSWLKRDAKGNVIAGIYFPLKPDFQDATFTIFIGLRAKYKFYFKDFLKIRNLHKDLLDIFDLLSKIMCCPKIVVLRTIKQLAIILSDQAYIEKIIRINIQIKDRLRRSTNDQYTETESNSST